MSVTGRLVSALAHDLRNTLQIVQSLPMIEESDLPDEDLLAVIDDVGICLADAAAIAVRMQDGIPAQAQFCSITAEIRSAVRQFRASLPSAIALVADIQQSGLVMLPPVEIRRVITNLVRNSRDAMPGGGTIRLTVRQDANEATVTVEDDGQGMSPSVLRRVFEPDFSTKGDAGNGLGLHTAREIVASCGGSIGVRSVRNEGTVFTVTLPIVHDIDGDHLGVRTAMRRGA